ncbi:photosynthetic complex assembly protein PuhC [Polymorphobacter sp.]|uniref:photosynthetic complex assembly protein PuhC n=1 Tax=Polymorphobacter sp. TaxID=1909290 RepID=UPI003F702291
MSGFHNEKFPVGALYGAGGLIGIALIAVFSVRAGLVEGRPTTPEIRAQNHVAVTKERLFRFADRKDGALVIRDAGTDAEVVVLEPGTNSGFIRGVMRGLMRERMLKETERSAPVRVTEWADGALTLTDVSTGRIIELGSFGPDNRRAFAAILDGRLPPVPNNLPDLRATVAPAEAKDPA